MDADERQKSMETLNRFAVETDLITEKIIGCSFTVSTELGSGFVEKVYENALAFELRKLQFEVEQQAAVKVKKEIVVGEYVCDLLVDRLVIVELKAVKLLDPVHMAQCLNYLKATGLNVCLLMNFGRNKLEFRRIVNHF